MGALNLSKIFKNRMRFYSYRAVLGLLPMPQIFSPFFSGAGVRSAGIGLVQSPYTALCGLEPRLLSYCMYVCIYLILLSASTFVNV